MRCKHAQWPSLVAPKVKFHEHDSLSEYLNEKDGFQSLLFKNKLVQEMHPAHYLEDEDTLMEDESDGADVSDIHDVSFQSNDSTLVGEGKLIQLYCNHLANNLQDLDPPVINIYKIGRDLDCELLLAKNYIDAHPYSDFTNAIKNIKILKDNNNLGDSRLRIQMSTMYTIWTGRLYRQKSKHEQTYGFRGNGFKATYKNNNLKNNAKVTLPIILPSCLQWTRHPFGAALDSEGDFV